MAVSDTVYQNPRGCTPQVWAVHKACDCITIRIIMSHGQRWDACTLLVTIDDVSCQHTF